MKHYRVTLTSYGQNKIATIKAVRAITDLGLKEAKDLVDSTEPEPTPSPALVLATDDFEQAERAKTLLVEAGAVAEVSSAHLATARLDLAFNLGYALAVLGDFDRYSSDDLGTVLHGLQTRPYTLSLAETAEAFAGAAAYVDSDTSEASNHKVGGVLKSEERYS